MSPSEAPRKTTTEENQPEGSRSAGIRWDATPIRSSAPPVQIVGTVRPYRGGGGRVHV